MAKSVLNMLAFSVCLIVNNAFCQEAEFSLKPGSKPFETADQNERDEDPSDSNIWRQIWGKKGRDALLLGMWSLHVDGTGEYLGNGSNNDQNHLLGIQYYGLSAGTFINSKDDRAWYFGPAREVYSHNFTDDTRFDIGYKLGLLYGYGDELINVGGMSLFAIATFGVSWKRLGFDLGVVPVGIITGNFRLDLDF